MSWGHYYSLWPQELHLPVYRNLHSLTADWQGAGEREKVLKDWEEEMWLQRCIRGTGFWQGAMCNSAQKCPWQGLEWTPQKKKVLPVCSQLDSQLSKLLSQGLGEGKLIPLVMKNACEEGEDIRALWRKKTTAPGFIIYIIINNDPIFPIPDFKIPNSL